MTTVEGVFPKIDGDPLFASEANTFFPKLIGKKEGMGANINISGTTIYVPMGSIVYPGTGSLIFHSFLKAEASIETGYGVGAPVFNFRMRISGLDMNIAFANKAISQYDDGMWMTINHIITATELIASGGNTTSKYSISVEGKNAIDSAIPKLGDFTVFGF